MCQHGRVGNHVGYRRFKGRNSTPEEVADLHEGLKNAGLNNFDVMLSGYCPSVALVEQVGIIARERKLQATTKPGSFFWIMDPVMGDNGRIYVAEDTVPAYKSLLKDADLILPNQFEAELLSDVKIHDLPTMKEAITKLHQVHRVPHAVITSIRLPSTQTNTPKASLDDTSTTAGLSVIGSTATSERKPRLFRITIPALPVFFSGTGDMFAAILVARLRQSVQHAGVLNQENWRSPDEVTGPELPLAKATEMVLASMHTILKDTAQHYAKEAEKLNESAELNEGVGEDADNDKEVEKHLKLTRAAEVRIVRNAKALLMPPNLENFKAQPIQIDAKANEPEAEPDELGVVKVADGQGAVHQT